MGDWAGPIGDSTGPMRVSGNKGFSATEPGLLDLKNAVVNSTLLTQIIAAEECKVIFSYRIKNFLPTANATTDAGTYQHTSYRLRDML
jgi:hypothetical protein